MLQYPINYSYFSAWSHNMAYVLGFFSGDGSLYKNKKNCIFAINLHKKDEVVLNFIRNEISPTRPISNFIQIQKSGLITPKVGLSLCCNPQMLTDLNKLGLCYNKTYNKKLPNVPDEFKFDYLRGYFDADGSFIIYKRPDGNNRDRYIWAISCICKDFLSNLQEKIGMNLGRICKGKSTFDWRIDKRDDIEKICNLIYNGNFHLPRKKDRFDNMQKQFEYRKYAAFGESKNIIEWQTDPRFKVTRKLFYKRIHELGWDSEKAMTVPSKRNKLS